MILWIILFFKSEVPVDEDILTTFQNSPRIPVYLLGMLIFRTDDFGYSEQNTVKGMPVSFLNIRVSIF